MVSMRNAMRHCHTCIRHRSFGTLTSTNDFDVVVVGSGAMGSSVAYHLALLQPDLKICVLERDTTFTHCSAMLSAGGIRQQFSLPTNIELSMYGIEFLKRLRCDLAVPGQDPPDVQFREQGYLFLAGEEGEEILRQNHATQRSCGVDWTSLLTPVELAARFPWLNTDGVALGCVGEHSEGWFDPWSYITALRRKAQSMGVHFKTGEITAFGCTTIDHGRKERSADPRYNHEVPPQRRIDTVVVNTTSSTGGAESTGKGEAVQQVLGAGTVVNAAGAFSADVVKMCGNDVLDLPVRPRRRSVFSVHCAQPPHAPTTPPFTSPPSSSSSSSSSSVARAPDGATTPLVVCPGTGAYFRPDGASGGKFLCGVSPPRGWPDVDGRCWSELEESGGETDKALFEDIIWPSLYERCEAFAGLKVKSSWAGFYEYNTLDQNGIIGPHRDIPNMVLCSGFSGHGLQQSPGAGRAVAELITGASESPSVDVSCFSFDRVVKNEPIFEENIV